MRTVEAVDVDRSLDLDALREVLREHPVRLAILFGSHAKGQATATSDIDIAVELDSHRPSDPDYNDAFLGLSADLSHRLGTDGVDIVDIRTVSPPMARSIFDDGVLLVGDRERAQELREEIALADTPERSPRERIDAVLDKMDAHLDDDETTAPASGESENDG